MMTAVEMEPSLTCVTELDAKTLGVASRLTMRSPFDKSYSVLMEFDCRLTISVPVRSIELSSV